MGVLAMLGPCLAVSLAAPGPAVAQEAAYHRAEQFLTWNTLPLISHDLVIPHWMKGDRFWFRDNGPEGAEYLVVDPQHNTQRPLFENGRLAEAMSLANDTVYDPHALPFGGFDLTDDERVIQFRADARLFRCDIEAYTCMADDTAGLRSPLDFPSPDGKWVVFTRDHNLYVKPTSGGDSVALTHDGVEDHTYGASQGLSLSPLRPVGQWSPDSRYFAVRRLDQRDVPRMPLYSSTRERPVLYTYPYPLPGDSVIPRYDVYVADVVAHRTVKVDVPSTPYPMNGISPMAPDGTTWWAVKWTEDGDALFVTTVTRANKKVTLWDVDPETGSAHPVVRDSSRTYVEVNEDVHRPPNWDVVNGGDDVIWWSERDGWGHLYRYDRDGGTASRVTGGGWTVGDLMYVDGTTRQVFFTARGRQPGVDPYFAPLYVENFDGSDLRLLTPEEAQHVIHFAPDGRYFTDTYSRVDQPQVTVLRDREGRIVRTVARADISRLSALGWKPPEPFHVKARDGIHDVYGVLFKPSNFDPRKKYPVIDHIYGGPQTITAPKWFFPTREPVLNYATIGQPPALAELGFVVVEIDAMGTNLRSKAWHDTWYGNLGDAGLPDHVHGLKQLAASRPWMDLTRLGVYGFSGGGFATVDAMLSYPDFYKVGVAASGNQDNRTYSSPWAERYQGLLQMDTVHHTDSYENQKNYLRASRLRGKLLLVTGDMDDNVHPANTIRLVNALVGANKSFDLLIMPDRGHGYSQEPYFIRRVWDFFVRQLLGEEPPYDYRIEQRPR